MPRVSNLTDAGRKKAAAKTNALIAERKRKRLETVHQLHQEGKTPAEMANFLDVSQRTIKRDLDTLRSENTGASSFDEREEP
ncbi:MAG: HTH domain-containing protein [Candidatus Poribacteria bacterium]|nr:HTH domain-containing protein [Candidatus Poribacteria bacterium]